MSGSDSSLCAGASRSSVCLFRERTFKFRTVSQQEFEVLDLGEVTAQGGGKNIAKRMVGNI